MVRQTPIMSGFVPVPARDIAILEASSAGQEILSTYNVVNLVSPLLFPSDRKAHASTGDSMMNTTFATPETIPEWVTVYAPAEVAGEEYPFGIYSQVLLLGSSLNGHPHKIHGGALSLILDEAMGRASRHHCTDGTVSFTATMTVDYKKAVTTPGELVVRSWLEGRSEGRKHWVRAEVLQNGVCVSEGRCLFLEVPMPEEYAKFGVHLRGAKL